MQFAWKEITIISGGQTGADRAALDWAIRHQVPHCGHCPKGRLAEDGVIPPRYNLVEISKASYPLRTEKNVLDSDGTVIFTLSSRLSGGSKLTAELAGEHGKPLLHLHKSIERPAELLIEFIRAHNIRRLNVAGSRASKEPDMGAFVTATLDGLTHRWA